MTSRSRVTRGRQSESIVADFLRERGFPQAERVAASLKGADITGTPGIAVEVKSRYGLQLDAWMKQAAKREGLPVLVVRLNGQGPATIAEWPMIIPFGTGVELLRKAGYGTGYGEVADGLSEDKYSRGDAVWLLGYPGSRIL